MTARIPELRFKFEDAEALELAKLGVVTKCPVQGVHEIPGEVMYHLAGTTSQQDFHTALENLRKAWSEGR